MLWSFVTFRFLLRLGEKVVHTKNRLFVHLELHRRCSCCLVSGSGVSCLGIDCTSVSKQRFVVKVIVLTVWISCLKASSIVKKSLIIGKILVGRLSLSKSHFFADISLFFSDLFFLFTSNLFEPFFSFNFSHTMVSKFFSFLNFLILIFIVLLLMNFLVLFSCLESGLSQIFFLLQILLIIDASLNFGSFLELQLWLSFCNVQGVYDVSKRLIYGVVLKRPPISC